MEATISANAKALTELGNAKLGQKLADPEVYKMAKAYIKFRCCEDRHHEMLVVIQKTLHEIKPKYRRKIAKLAKKVVAQLDDETEERLMPSLVNMSKYQKITYIGEIVKQAPEIFSKASFRELSPEDEKEIKNWVINLDQQLRREI
jgi:hypothetical protein